MLVDMYKKDIYDIYRLVDKTRHLKRFNNVSYIEGYEDSVLNHSGRVTFLAIEMAYYLMKEFNVSVDVFLMVRIAMFHDLAEMKTGDLSGPVKDEVPEIRRLLELVEQEYLKDVFYKSFINQIYNDDSIERQIVFLADKLDVLFQMNILENKYPKRTDQYKNIQHIKKAALKRIEKIDIYKKYFKQFFKLGDVYDEIM
jgi:5'-deoxynucleotidase YfbR-like HD superfamily hydrolase